MRHALLHKRLCDISARDGGAGTRTEDVVEQSHCDLLTNAQGFELIQEEDLLEAWIKLGNR